MGKIFDKLIDIHLYQIICVSDFFISQFIASRGFKSKNILKEAVKIMKYTEGGVSLEDIKNMSILSYCNLLNAIIEDIKDEQKK